MCWSVERVDDKFYDIMQHIHKDCIANGQKKKGIIDYVQGTIITGFKKVAYAMLAYGPI